MDRRYLLIIAITIICCLNLYIISDVSDIVGSASIDCNNYTFSAPEGFVLYETAQKYTEIHDSSSGMNIYINPSISKSDTYANKIKEISDSNSSDSNSSNSEYTLLSKGTLDVEGIKVDSVYYQPPSGENRALFYFDKMNDHFKILITDFDYDSDRNKTIEHVTDIVSSLRINYKIKNK